MAKAKFTPTFEVTASGSYWGESYGTTIETLHKANVSWADAKGRKFHIWLGRNATENEGAMRWLPERHSNGRGTLYMNPPRNEDGSHKKHRDAGWFKTRHLDIDAAAHADAVQAALAYANSGAVEADAERQIAEGIANIAAENKAEAERIRAAFKQAMDESLGAGEITARLYAKIEALAAELGDPSWLLLGRAVRK